MKKIKRIIVGLDVFKKSNNVLKRTLMVAKQNKAELFIIHTVETPWLSVPSYFAGKEITVDTKGITKKIEKKIKALNKDNEVPCSIVVREGDADDILLYESKLLKADMIVIGANTKSKKNFLGTTAEKVAHQSHLPVLIVKNRVKDPYKNIVAPTDFQVQSKQSILFAKNIFPAVKIKAVHTYETFYAEGIYAAGSYTLEGLDIQEYNKAVKASGKNDLKKLMKDLSIKKGKIIDGEPNSKEALLKYINKGSYDLVVIGSRGTSGFKALLGSVASSILRETPTDVLIYVPID
ncbi:universal stress protein [Sulfurovum sp. CS9]|uniref:universal stress protein n=1 Tax=Sulfurovum sp. CS9 TaxID=3391146 RepID=UPI0039E7FB7A